ncbi:MAG: hypothetical protein U9O94_01285 [Nanoarchaeota archaeon]|nr:hypothetical protein [Nanoarchaeota archaeon]
MNNLQCTCPNCKFEYTIPLDTQLLRTVPQNKAYWAVYVKNISDHTGYFPEEVHEELKILFNPKDSKFKLGERYGGSTTRMKRKEFSEYLENIRIWAFETLSVVLPIIESKRRR